MAKKNSSSTETKVEAKPFVFGKYNYRLMLISIVIVAVGFILMMGDTDIYDFRKIVLAPIIVLLGFAIGFFSILGPPKRSK